MRATNLKASGRVGFTLIELMVAIGVTALLVGLMLTITMNVMGGWNKSSGSLTSGNQARLVLDMLSRDLQGAVIKKDGNVWFAATIQKDQTGTGDAGIVDANWMPSGVPQPSGSTLGDNSLLTDTSFVIPALVSPSTVPVLEDYRFGKGGVWLRFLTSATDTNVDTTAVSAPRAVSYQIVRLPVVPLSTEFRYLLFRSEVNSANTFSAGFNLFDAAYDTPTPIPTAVTDAGILRRPEITAANRGLVIANNVIDFGVRVFTRNDSSATVNGTLPGALFNTPSFPDSLSPSLIGFAATTDSNKASGLVTSGLIVHKFPSVVEVFVRVLTDEGVLQIDNLENGRITGDWWDIALKNSKVFTRRVELNSNGL